MCPEALAPMVCVDDPEILRSVLDTLPTGVYLVDAHGKIVLWNSAAERITGRLRQELLGRDAREGFLGYQDMDLSEPGGQSAPLSVAIRDGKSSGSIVNLRHKLGHRVAVRLHAAPIRNSRGSVIGAVESFEETSTAANWEQRQSKLATYGCIDGTSGVLTREMVGLHLREQLALFAQHPVPLSLLCISIDGLETLRKRYGPAVLSPIAKAVGMTLENSLRPTDFLGRWRENEFVAILGECGLEELPLVAGRLRKMVHAAEIEWWGDAFKVTASMGGASAGPGDTPELLLARAEAALDEAMCQGGNRVVIRTR